jgi:hypothetical protein
MRHMCWQIGVQRLENQGRDGSRVAPSSKPVLAADAAVSSLPDINFF